MTESHLVEVVRQALIGGWGADADRAELLAHLSGGRLGWAVRRLRDEAALDRRDRRLDDLDRLLDASIVERFRYAQELGRDQAATLETFDLWIGWWRDVLLLASGAEAALTHVDREPGLREHARRFGVETSSGVVAALRSAADRLNRNANARLTLEVLMLDLPRP